MSANETLDECARRMGVFMQNRAAFPPEELLKYAGQWIAWNPEGTAIIASSRESEKDIYDTLKANGHDLSQCCVSYVDDDRVDLGGALLFNTEDHEEETPASS